MPAAPEAAAAPAPAPAIAPPALTTTAASRPSEPPPRVLPITIPVPEVDREAGWEGVVAALDELAADPEGATSADRARRYLAQGLLLVRYDPGSEGPPGVIGRFCSYDGSTPGPGCDGFQAWAHQNPQLFPVRDRRFSYSGWHFQEVLRMAAGTVEADYARCMLGLLRDRAAVAWTGAACAAFLERTLPGPCPAELPGVGAPEVVLGCEASGLRGPESAAPAALLATARLLAKPDDRLSRLWELRPDLFLYDEPGGTNLYNGRHLRLLLERHPDAAEADDAAWELAILPQGGECEGFVACYLGGGVGPLEAYLERQPRGRHVTDGVEQARTCLRMNLERLQEGKSAKEDLDPAAVTAVLSRYERVSRSLPGPRGAELLREVAPWWRQLGDPRRAAAVEADAARRAPPP
jgi:hypothetical protein